MKRRLIVVQARQRKRYDRRCRNVRFAIGDLVWVHHLLRKKGRSKKLLHPFFGPFEIVKKINDLNYIVVPATGRKKSPDRVHVSSLKPFHTRLPSSAVGNCAEGQATPATRAVNKLKASQVAGPQHPRCSSRVGAERRAQSTRKVQSAERRARRRAQSSHETTIRPKAKTITVYRSRRGTPQQLINRKR